MLSSREAFLTLALICTWVSLVIGGLVAWFWSNSGHVSRPLGSAKKPKPDKSLLTQGDYVHHTTSSGAAVLRKRGGRSAVQQEPPEVPSKQQLSFDDPPRSLEETFDVGKAVLEHLESPPTDEYSDGVETPSDLPIDETPRDEELQAQVARDEAHRKIALQQRSSTSYKTANNVRQREFEAESKSLFGELRELAQHGETNAERWESVLRAILNMLERIDAAFPGDRSAHIIAMTLVCNALLGLDGLNTLSSAKSKSGDAERLAQSAIEKVVPSIWSS
eukprot:Selendium_serpulae@DN5617_c0_g1_i1.p1